MVNQLRYKAFYIRKGKEEMEEELVKETARKFRSVNRAMMRIIDKRVSATQVYRGQHQVLMHIAHHPNASQAEIAESSYIEKVGKGRVY